MAAAALLIGASAAQAQGPEALTPGKTSIAFSIPTSGSNSFGIWKQLTPTRALGINAAVEYGRIDEDSGNDRSEFAISLAPSMKWYRSLSRTVAPFIQGSAGVGYNRVVNEVGDQEIESDGFNVNASAGLGVDWFPLNSISIGGFTGLRAAFGSFNNGNSDQTSALVRTFTSGLTMHIYF